MKNPLIIIIAALGGSLSAPAYAQNHPSVMNGASAKNAADDYFIEFRDDPLSAAPLDERALLLRVRRLAQRNLLIRPRAHFVSELIASADDF